MGARGGRRARLRRRGLLLALAVGAAGALATPAAAAPLISYPDFSSVVGLHLNGFAAQSGAVLRMTTAAPNEESSAYSTTQLNPGQSFSTSFELSMSNGASPNPADGMAFILQSQSITAVSNNSLGGALGYQGVTPSLAVEFDIYNGNPGDPGSATVNPADDHVGITENGDPSTYLACATVVAPPDAPCTNTLPAGVPLYGAPVFGWVDYDATAKVLSVFVSSTSTKPAAPTLTTPVDLAALLGASTFTGFTAATGTYYAQQDVLNWQLSYTPPANSGLPAVSGTAQAGQPLSASQGSWTESPSGYTYQWSSCDATGANCASLGAQAASPAYTPSAADVGRTLRFTVTAFNAGGSTAATSAPTAVVLIGAPVNMLLPAVMGTAQQGQPLAASRGSWSNSPTAYSYQWLLCDSAGGTCSSVGGATTPAYTPVAGDVGHTLRLTVTASNAGGATPATSAQTTVVSIAAAVLRHSADLTPVSGTVLVRPPGASTFTLLASASQVALGSTIDVRSGRVSLSVALPKGRSQTGEFYGGEFVLTQSANGTTILTLTGGSFAGCPVAPKSAKHGALVAVARKKPATVIRHLWGDAHGNYTTKGRYGAASVSGTIWLTQDRCEGTFVRVTKDSVVVVAFAHPKKKHKIHQGHQILVLAPGY